MKYRSDIDGLRAIAVLIVIAFHAGLQTFAGGYVGVDVFFVISGYLITTLLIKEMNEERFSFANFYKRRISRLMPALGVTLFAVFWLGFLFYDNHGFNHLGKQIFYSAFGLANIFFAGGDDYFASGVANQPLIHLWSLGVEEQFYLVWPVVILAILKFFPRFLAPIAFALFFISLVLSELAAQEQTPASYFLPQYRAYELLLGALTAMLVQRFNLQAISNNIRTILGAIGLILIFVPVFMLEKTSVFPGVNALWPCIGTALLIAFPSQSWTTRLLSARFMVLIGLISYPLYLYHQPMIAFIHLFAIELSPLATFTSVSLVTGGLAWLTYRYIETPIRKITSKGSKAQKRLAVGSLVMTIPVMAVAGVVVAKSDGLPGRFELLNPFAAKLNEVHAMPFYRNFSDGWQVAEQPKGKVLFIGDSVMQHYVESITKSLGYDPSQVDTITRGLCVMLKGVQYIDQIGTISCDQLRSDAYNLEKRYELVVISQAWQGYGGNVKNFRVNSSNLFDRWQDLLAATVSHFSSRAEYVLVVGAHPLINGTGGIRSRIFMTPERYKRELEELNFANPERLQEGRQFFDKFAKRNNVSVIHPEDIFCPRKCLLRGEKWSYFGDSVHISTAALPFVEGRFRELLAPLTQSMGPAIKEAE